MNRLPGGIHPQPSHRARKQSKSRIGVARKTAASRCQGLRLQLSQ